MEKSQSISATKLSVLAAFKASLPAAATIAPVKEVFASKEALQAIQFKASATTPPSILPGFRKSHGDKVCDRGKLLDGRPSIHNEGLEILQSSL
jgi:hypothetical protein